MRDELRGVDDLTPSLSIIEVVCPEVDIGAHGTDMTIILVLFMFHLIFYS